MTEHQWRNRIIGSGIEQTSQLLANPLNWRIHPKYQQDVLLSVLDRIGWIQQIIVNKRTGNVVDGHLRVSLALRRDEPDVPVVYVDIDENEERLIMAVFDPISALAVADRDQLKLLLADAHAVHDDISALVAGIGDDHRSALEDIHKKRPRVTVEFCVCPTCGHEHHRKEKSNGETQDP